MSKLSDWHDVDPAVIALFNQYMEVINAKLKAQGKGKVHKGQVTSAIVSRFILAHRSEIMNAYAAIQTKKLIKRARRALRPALPEGALTAFGLDVSDPAGASSGSPSNG